MLDTYTSDQMLEQFHRDVRHGLSSAPKTLPARWLYDDLGSSLFEQITQLPEYYPTRTETSILHNSGSEMAAFAGPGTVIIEYGAGSARKTEILLKALRPRAYIPIDIAAGFLTSSAQRLVGQFPSFAIHPVVADFTADFDLPQKLPEGRRIGFFPGSTIGNLSANEAGSLLRRMRRQVGEGGAAFIGIDLKKEVDILLAAYDDQAGVTAKFNLNLLARINRELGADFDLKAFKHQARWNAGEGAVEMHAVAGSPQTISLGGALFTMETGESVHTESARKYDLDGFARLTTRAGWNTGATWLDPKRRFAIVGLLA